MRALWVTNMWPDERRPWYGSFVFSQAQSLRRSGVELEVIYIPGYLGVREYAKGVAALRRVVRDAEFDVVHAHYGHAAAVARTQGRIPLVISYCGDDLLGTPIGNGSRRFSISSRLAARAFAELGRTAAATITKSEAMQARLPPKCRSRNHVIPNGVDLREFTPSAIDEARQRLGWKPGPPNVLFVGNPDNPRKNFRRATQVCAELGRRGRPVELRIAWDIPPGDVPVWMNASDALLFTSLSEGSPNAIKEAMAVELPIVSTPVGDVSERLAQVAGTFVVSDDVDALADALVAALDVGRTPAARRSVLELSVERVAERVVGVYEEVIG